MHRKNEAIFRQLCIAARHKHSRGAASYYNKPYAAVPLFGLVLFALLGKEEHLLQGPFHLPARRGRCHRISFEVCTVILHSSGKGMREGVMAL